jgi:hypothetical protein
MNKYEQKIDVHMKGNTGCLQRNSRTLICNMSCSYTAESDCVKCRQSLVLATKEVSYSHPRSCSTEIVIIRPEATSVVDVSDDESFPKSLQRRTFLRSLIQVYLGSHTLENVVKLTCVV